MHAHEYDVSVGELYEGNTDVDYDNEHYAD